MFYLNEHLTGIFITFGLMSRITRIRPSKDCELQHRKQTCGRQEIRHNRYICYQPACCHLSTSIWQSADEWFSDWSALFVFKQSLWLVGSVYPNWPAVNICHLSITCLTTASYLSICQCRKTRRSVCGREEGQEREAQEEEEHNIWGWEE